MPRKARLGTGAGSCFAHHSLVEIAQMSQTANSHPRRRRSGFSLIELMVVLVIVGITSSITAGKIQQLMVQNRIQRAATSVQYDMEAAFAIAVRNRRPMRISWNSATQQMAVTDRAGTTVFRHTNLTMGSYGLRSSGVSFSASPIEVYPDGLASDTLTITISSTSLTKTVRMSRAGMVLIQ
jgi:type II secretion system protein H